jgi:hypothetical protein
MNTELLVSQRIRIRLLPLSSRGKSLKSCAVRASSRIGSRECLATARTDWLQTSCGASRWLTVSPIMLGRLASSSRIVVLLKTPLAQGIRRHALPLVGGSAVGLAGACVFSAATTSCDASTGVEPAGPSLLQKCVAEAIGTGMIVAGGCGVVCAAKYAGHAVTPLGIGAAFGLSVTLAIYATGVSLSCCWLVPRCFHWQCIYTLPRN